MWMIPLPSLKIKDQQDQGQDNTQRYEPAATPSTCILYTINIVYIYKYLGVAIC